VSSIDGRADADHDQHDLRQLVDPEGDEQDGSSDSATILSKNRKERRRRRRIGKESHVEAENTAGNQQHIA
jgi:hypothetical protein